MSSAKQEYDHIGTVDGRETVVTENGDEYHLPPTFKRQEQLPLHSRTIAFNAEPTAHVISDRVTKWKVIDSSPDLDTSGEVVYTHCNRVYLSVDGYEDDIRAWKSNFYGNPTEGDTVIFDWHTEGTRIWNGEVVEDE